VEEMENWQLQQLKALQLDVKIRKTQERIKEWYEHYNGEVYVSFSGGKDSTVLLDIARKMYPEIEGVFCDTGMEYPEIRDFVKTFSNIKWIKPCMYEKKSRNYVKTDFRSIILDIGYPIISKEVSQVISEARKNKETGKCSYRIKRLNGELKDKKGNKSIYNCEKYKFLMDSDFKISHKCCDIMKKNPVHQYEKQTGKKPFIGTMTDESMARKTAWIKNGCNSFDSKRPNSKPLSFWTEQDILKYIKINNLKIAKVYGDVVEDQEIEGQQCIDGYNCKYKTTGVKRTGCMFCMFGAHLEKEEDNRFLRMKKTHPKQYDYCMKSVDDGGLGLAKVLDFIGVKY
jgi:3'-phosphoadenosine 5'-phosphosulfate sulfotransferase (PAPS reductase)/FAD synthetase